MEIKGRIRDIIYRNEINSYTIATFEIDEEETTVVGYLPFIEIPYDKAVLLCQGQRQEKLENCKFEGCSLDYTDTIQIKTDGMFIGVGHIQKGVLISDRMMSDPLHTNLGLYKD